MNQLNSPIKPDFTAPDGRECWKRQNAFQFLELCQNQDLAILQLRVWCVLKHIYDDLTITESIHLSTTDIRLFSWQCDIIWDEENESWEKYSKKTCSAAKEYLKENQIEEIIAPPLKDAVHYYIESISKADFLEE